MSGDRSSYFAVLHETSSQVRPFIRSALLSLQERDRALFLAAYSPLLERVCEERPLQKPTLLRLAFEASGGKNWKDILPVGAALELLNLSTYLGNLGLDGKGFTSTTEDRCRQFLAATTCREEASSILVQCGSAEVIKIFLLDSFSRVNSAVHFGQHLDIDIEETSSFLRTFDLPCFQRRYESRCRALSGVFNRAICEMGASLAGAEPPQIESLAAFGEYYGTALQIVNDVADCTPSEWEPILAKDYQGNFADIRNGRLTLAVAHALAVSPSDKAMDLRLFIGRRSLDAEEKDFIARVLWTSGSVYFVKSVVRSYLRKAKDLLRLLSERAADRPLGVLASVLVCNKYWKAWDLRFGEHQKG